MEFTISEDFKSIADILPQIVWTSKPDGNLDYFNRKWFEYTGLSEEESADLGIHKVIHPDDREETVKKWQDAFNHGRNFEMEYRIKGADGTYRWFLGRSLPIKDRSGKISKWVGTCTDIHDQKKQTEELKKINKDLDSFVYTASHDLRAPVSNFEGLLLAMSDSLSPKLSEEEGMLMSLVNESIKVMKRTIQDLTEISRIQKMSDEDIQELPVKASLEQAEKKLAQEIRESKAVIKTDWKVDKITFSKKNFDNLVYHLLSNAIKYKSPERLPEVSISTYKSGDYTVFCIKDNGLGFDITKTDKAFAMFKRLHTHVDGSGIGLYIVKRIAENSGGRVEAESQEGKGSTFKVYLKELVPGS